MLPSLVEIFPVNSDSMTKISGDNTSKFLEFVWVVDLLLGDRKNMYFFRILFSRVLLSLERLFRCWYGIDDCHIQELVLQ